MWSLAYGGVGQLLEAAGPEPGGPPAGRVMQFQAIDAGDRIHALLSRMPVYRRAATASSAAGLVEEIGELVAAPLLAGMMASNEAARDMLAPLFVQMIRRSAVAIAKAQKEQAQAMSDVAEYAEEADELAAQMWEALFDPPAGHDDQGPGADVYEPATGWPRAAGE